MALKIARLPAILVLLITPAPARLLAVHETGRAYRWETTPAAWGRQACAVAGRALTRAEWQQLLPDRDYAPACGGADLPIVYR